MRWRDFPSMQRAKQDKSVSIIASGFDTFCGFSVPDGSCKGSPADNGFRCSGKSRRKQPQQPGLSRYATVSSANAAATGIDEGSSPIRQAAIVQADGLQRVWASAWGRIQPWKAQLAIRGAEHGVHMFLSMASTASKGFGFVSILFGREICWLPANRGIISFRTPWPFLICWMWVPCPNTSTIFNLCKVKVALQQHQTRPVVLSSAGLNRNQSWLTAARRQEWLQIYSVGIYHGRNIMEYIYIYYIIYSYIL